VKRRDFITLLGGAAATWPLVARGQQGDRMRRIGVLMNLAADDSEAQARNAAFLQGLSELGWTVGRNLRIDYRWGAGDTDLFRKYAKELVALAPDVILAASGSTVPALLQATRTVPIVFTQTTDPVAAGFVSSLSRPGRNATGFTNYEFSIGGKWLELLKQLVPRVMRVGVLRDIVNAAQGIPQFAAIQTAAPLFGIDLTPIGVSESTEIESGINEFLRGPNDGLIVTASPLTAVQRTQPTENRGASIRSYQKVRDRQQHLVGSDGGFRGMPHFPAARERIAVISCAGVWLMLAAWFLSSR
jgi:putative ABC transport system substrate-binding protein